MEIETITNPMSSGDENPQSPKRKIRRGTSIQYNKYIRTWEHKPLFRGWLKPVEGDSTRAYCTICDKLLMARVNLLGKHARTSAHRNNIPFDIPMNFPQNENNSDEECSPKVTDRSPIKVEILDPTNGILTKKDPEERVTTYFKASDTERIHYNVQSDSYCINDINYMRSLSKENPRNLVPQLCRQFHDLGWFQGNGGGMSLKFNDFIYATPAGVQLDLIQPDELFCHTQENVDVELPNPDKSLKKNRSTPLFLLLHNVRSAGAIIHSHSTNAVLVTLLWPDKEFCISRQEMIKGIRDDELGRNLRYDEKLIVPIVENTHFEKDLESDIENVLDVYKGTCAILVRRHGLFCWGENWKSAKRMVECYEYLFNIAIEMKKLGLDPERRQLNLIDDIENS